MDGISGGRARLLVCLALVAVLAAACEPVPPPAVRLVDSFDRADAPTLGNADSGQTWSALHGSWEIAAGAAAAGQGYSLAVAESGGATGVVSTQVTVPSQELWLVVRATDGSNYWRFGRTGGGAYQLQKIVGGRVGDPVPRLATRSAAAGDQLSCGLLAGAISCSVNGTTVAAVQDGFNAAATQVGLATYRPGGPSAARFDQFRVTDLPAASELAVTATSSPSVAVGDPLSWTVTVRNLGPVAAAGTSLAAPLPAGVTAVSASTTSGSCTTTGSLACSLGSLAPDQSVTVTVTATAAATPGSTLTATASTTTAELSLFGNVAASTATITPPPPAGLRVSDDFARPDAPSLGTAPTGQVWAVHHGGFGVAAGQAAPTSAGYSMATIDTGESAGVVSATLATPSDEFWLILRAANGSNYWRFGRTGGGAYQLQLIVANGVGAPSVATHATVQPEAGDEIECWVRAVSLRCAVDGQQVASTSDATHAAATAVGLASYGSDLVRVDDLLVVDVPVAPDVAVQVDDDDPVVVDGTLRWAVTLTNVGDAATAGTSLVATLPSSPAGLAASTTGGSCAVGAGTVTCSMAPLGAGGSALVHIEAVAPAAPGMVGFSVTGTTTGDVDPTNDTATESTQVLAALPPGARVFDEFERPDAGALGAAQTGEPWSVLHGGFGIVGGRAAPTAQGFDLATIDGGGASGVVSLDVPVLSTEFWLIVRASDGENYWRFGRSGGGGYQLQQIVDNGLGSPAVTYVPVPPPAAGDRMSCTYLDGAISCSVNGALAASVASGADPDAQDVGMAAWDPAATPTVRFDRLAVVDVPPILDVSIAITDLDPVLVDGNLRWTVVVANPGTVAATDVVVDLTLPSGISNVGMAPSQGSCQPASCSLGGLAPGASAQVVVTATAPSEPTTLTLSAAVSVAGTDANPANDTDQEATTVRLPPPPGAHVVDGFGGTGALVTAETGETWTVEAGGFAMSGGQLAPTSSALAVAAVETGFAYGTYELTVAEVGTGDFWLAFRVVDSLNYFRVGPDESGFYRLDKVVNGQVQPVAISIHRAHVEAADGDVIRVVNRPDDGMFVAVNGIHIVDAGDVESMTVSRFGVAAASASVRFDHLDIGQVMTATGVITDNFTRADGTPMGRVASGVSYDWWSRAGGDWGIQSGQAYFTGTGYGVVGADTTSEAADVRARVTQISDEFGLVFRYSEDDTYYRFGRPGPGANYEIELMDGCCSTTPPVPIERLADPVPANGDLLEIRQYLDGRVEALVNGVLVLRFTDTVTNVRGTIYGFASGGSTARFDNFRVVPE